MTMNVNLTPQLEEMVRQKVATGLYNSASEVIREALRLMGEQDRVRLEALRAAVAVGLAQAERGEVAAWSPELHTTIRRRAVEKAATGERPKTDVLPRSSGRVHC